MASLDACKTLAVSTLGAETPGTARHCVRIISEFLSLKDILEDLLIPPILCQDPLRVLIFKTFEGFYDKLSWNFSLIFINYRSEAYLSHPISKVV